MFLVLFNEVRSGRKGITIEICRLKKGIPEGDVSQFVVKNFGIKTEAFKKYRHNRNFKNKGAILSRKFVTGKKEVEGDFICFQKRKKLWDQKVAAKRRLR